MNSTDSTNVLPTTRIGDLVARANPSDTDYDYGFVVASRMSGWNGEGGVELVDVDWVSGGDIDTSLLVVTEDFDYASGADVRVIATADTICPPERRTPTLWRILINFLCAAPHAHLSEVEVRTRYGSEMVTTLALDLPYYERAYGQGDDPVERNACSDGEAIAAGFLSAADAVECANTALSVWAMVIDQSGALTLRVNGDDVRVYNQSTMSLRSYGDLYHGVTVSRRYDEDTDESVLRLISF